MAELVWDERLISRDEAWRLAGPRPVRPGIRNRLLFADCGECGQAVLPLGTARLPFTTTLDQLRDAVLRHAVSAHSMALNHRRGPDGDHGAARAGSAQPGGAVRGGPEEHAAAGVRRRVPGVRGAAATGRRPAPETTGGDREPGFAGGDRE